jgi:hypothetical protein
MLNDFCCGARINHQPATKKAIGLLFNAIPSSRIDPLINKANYRTFAMLCPILPQPMSAFLTKVATDIRPVLCEHVWAEVINVRGDSMSKTIAGLTMAGLTKAAAALTTVSGSGHKLAWEEYALNTFLALADIIPCNPNEPKLRFLQYVTKDTRDWWAAQIPRGAVVL